MESTFCLTKLPFLLVGRDIQVKITTYECVVKKARASEKEVSPKELKKGLEDAIKKPYDQE
jgi:hypothetical protein